MIVNCDRCNKSFKPKWPKKGQQKFYCNNECRKKPRLDKVCLHCGKDFQVLPKDRKRKYCSQKCSQIDKRVRIDRVCLRCRKVLQVLPSDERKYCSRKCANPSRTITKTCLGCQKDFQIKPKERKQKYCSFDCYNESKRAKNTFQCKQCGTSYYRSPAHEERSGGFCSRKCFGLWETGANNPYWKGGEIECTCLNCNQVFFRPRADYNLKGAKFCSTKCRDSNKEHYDHLRKHKIGKICAYCAGTYYVQPSLSKQVFCSRVCADRAHAYVVTGKGNGRYVHGECADNGYHVYFPRSLRRAIYDRDGHKCRWCGMPEEEHSIRLHVHHIDYDKKNGSIDNLITLCRFCHGKMHGGEANRAKWKKEMLNLLKKSKLK